MKQQNDPNGRQPANGMVSKATKGILNVLLAAILSATLFTALPATGIGINSSPFLSLAGSGESANEATPQVSLHVGLVVGHWGHGDDVGAVCSESLAGELLWKVYQMGFPDDIWLTFLAEAEEWLDDWFSPGLDKDDDGIPELIHPRIFDLAGSLKTEAVISESHLISYPYLESPALGALLFNDLCRINDLLKISGNKQAHHHQERKDILLNFLRESLSPESSEFQNRDSHSHLTAEGFIIIEKLQPGLNILRETFPQPTRIGVLHHRSTSSSSPGDFSIIYHGLDWQGNYRIEEQKSGELFFGKDMDWGISESVYSKLDYCVLNDEIQRGRVSLIAPSTSMGDITQNLPLWAGALAEQQAREIIKKILLDPDRYWSHFGFSTHLESGPEIMYLFWNLLLGQSLYSLGMVEEASELTERWMKAVAKALAESGSSYPAYGIKNGEGMGRDDSLESLFPVRFFLQVLGIEIIQDSHLSIEGLNPYPWPVTIKFRGIEIRREKKQTSIKRPNQETIVLSGGDKIHIDLY